MPKIFYQSLHAFRAFAIINIVSIHVFLTVLSYSNIYGDLGEDTIKSMMSTVMILFQGSTLYFTLISGILFSVVLADRGYYRFYSSKFIFVVLPYLFFTVIYSFRSWHIEGKLVVFDGSVIEFIQLVFFNFITGGALFTLWYIPILIFLYLVTPVLAWLMNHKWGKFITFIIMISPLVFSRTWPDMIWQNYAYFLGAYMLGIYVGSNYKKILILIKRFIYPILIIVVLSKILLMIIFSYQTTEFLGIDLKESVLYIQKIAISALVLLFLEFCLNKLGFMMDLLAKYAFSIYFIHAYLLFEIWVIAEKFNVVLNTIPWIILACITCLLLTLLLSCLLTFVVKKIIGSSSRYVLGA